MYFSWPSASGPSWIYLGKISNQKPSAIFKISKPKGTCELLALLCSNPFVASLLDNEPNSGLALFSAFQQANSSSVPSDGLLGISVEELTQLDQLVQPADVNPSTVASHVEFVSKMLNQFVNYVTSFVQPVPGSSEQIVPLSVVTTWYNNFQRRLAENPNFWKQQN